MELAFGPFVLDKGTRQLRRGSAELHLSPKAFELLGVLVARRPQAIAKVDLHEQLWPDSFVSDGSLAVLIAEIRRTLGDSAERPTYIRTVPRFGYAFLAEGHGIAARDVEDGLRHVVLARVGRASRSAAPG